MSINDEDVVEQPEYGFKSDEELIREVTEVHVPPEYQYDEIQESDTEEGEEW